MVVSESEAIPSKELQENAQKCPEGTHNCLHPSVASMQFVRSHFREFCKVHKMNPFERKKINDRRTSHLKTPSVAKPPKASIALVNFLRTTGTPARVLSRTSCRPIPNTRVPRERVAEARMGEGDVSCGNG